MPLPSFRWFARRLLRVEESLSSPPSSSHTGVLTWPSFHHSCGRIVQEPTFVQSHLLLTNVMCSDTISKKVTSRGGSVYLFWWGHHLPSSTVSIHRCSLLGRKSWLGFTGFLEPRYCLAQCRQNYFAFDKSSDELCLGASFHVFQVRIEPLSSLFSSHLLICLVYKLAADHPSLERKGAREAHPCPQRPAQCPTHRRFTANYLQQINEGTMHPAPTLQRRKPRLT